jgi:hypothetical protein
VLRLHRDASRHGCPHSGQYTQRLGELAERLNAPVLKTGDVARRP